MYSSMDQSNMTWERSWDIHINRDSGIGSVFTLRCEIWSFDEDAQLVPDGFQDPLIPIIHRQGVESEPDWNSFEIFLLWNEVGLPVRYVESYRVVEVWASFESAISVFPVGEDDREKIPCS